MRPHGPKPRALPTEPHPEKQILKYNNIYFGRIQEFVKKIFNKFFNFQLVKKEQLESLSENIYDEEKKKVYEKPSFFKINICPK